MKKISVLIAMAILFSNASYADESESQAMAAAAKEFELGRMRDRGEIPQVETKKVSNRINTPLSNERKCNNGSAIECYKLGYLYESGHGIKKDLTKASHFYSQGCNLGNPDACFSLGVMYYNGKGVYRDENKAIQLYRKACSGGIQEACFAANFR